MKLASAFNHSPNLVTLTRLADDLYVDVNDAFERVLGYSRSSIIGQNPVALGVWDGPRRERFLNALRKYHSIANQPASYRRRDGGEYQGLLNAEVVSFEGEDYVLCIVQDLVPADPVTETSRKSALDHATEAVYVTSPEGRFLEANPVLARLLGYASPEELLREVQDIGVQVYADPDMRVDLLAALERDGQVENREAQLRRRDGSLIWISENAQAVRDATGKLQRIAGSFVDVSARKEVEAALQLSEQKYRTLVDHSQDGVFITQEGIYTYVNQAYADMLGYDVMEMTGSPYADFIAPEDRRFLEELWKKRRAGQWEQNAYEVQLLKKDGRTRVLASVRSGPIMLGGRLASTGTIRDITEERRTQQALLAAEQKYRAIFENAVVGMYQSTPTGQYLKANNALARIFGFDTPEEMFGNIKNISELYRSPDERSTVNTELERVGLVTGREVEMRRRDGQSIWISLSARVVRDAEGAVAYYEGSLHDITARKRVEAALQSSEQRYRMLVDHSQVGVFINENGRYSYVNHAFATMLGYTEAELTGMSYRDIFPPDELAAADSRFLRRQRGEDVPNNYESTLLCKDKKTRLNVTHSIGTIDVDDHRFMIGTVRDITDQKRIEEQLRHNATHDPLTGLPNRTLFIERLAKAMERSQPQGSPGYAVLFIDLDSFNVVNDSLGHAAGDELLVQVAQRLKQCLGPWDTLARHGGDEFTVLVGQTLELDDAVEVAERMLAELMRPVKLGDNEIYTNASIGIAPGNPDYTSTEELLRDADTAMYRAKAAGKAGYVVFDQEMYAKARARLRVETELRQALENREMRVHYQPIVTLQTGQLLGFEALLRWQHPVRGLLGPDEFLKVAEETGLILPIGWWLLREACRQTRTWRDRHPEARDLTMAVNLAHKQFMYTGLPQQVSAALQETGLPADGLHLEITETVFLENPKAAESTLRRLRSLGIALHLDDFGTGYSSLSYLSALPLDTLKIDRSFVMDMERNPKHAAIVRTIVELARDLGMNTVAEGVESTQQLRLLDELGCRSGQGILFSPALDMKRADRLFERETLALVPGEVAFNDTHPRGFFPTDIVKRTRDFFRRV
ncbi:MAG TPA: PAS domain S-box protein [Gammaproteobacteria bacterium]|nr:PAS domain S-box protein [Gammaproteobacteria bacterium]